MSNSNPLSKEFIAIQRVRLEELKAELLGADATALKDAKDLQEASGEEAEEFEDAAQSLDRKEVLQARHDVDRQRLSNIERALQKIELGTYGLSDLSNRPIPEDRLAVAPEAVLTVDEAAARE